jgi:hypothetical protein
MIGLIIVVLMLVGSPLTASADFIMTLQATSGTLTQFQDSAFGSGVSGPGFSLYGFGPQDGSALPITLEDFVRPMRGQLVDQSGQLVLAAPHAAINGHQCCQMSGVINISSIPAAPVIQSNSLTVTAPFVASGTLLGTGPVFFIDQGPYGQYLFEGAGTMTSVFRATCLSSGAADCFVWNSSVVTFERSTSSVPEPSAWLLLGSGLVFLARRRRGLS